MQQAQTPAAPKPPQLKMTKLMDEVLDYPMPEGYAIRNIDGSEEDIAAWISICKNGVLPSGADRSAYDSRITNWKNRQDIRPETDVFMVYEEESGTVVATITGFVMADGDGDIHMVAVDPVCRGKKIGHAMLSHALKKLKADGVPRVHLTTDDWRRPAIRNYLVAGFRPVWFEGVEERWDIIFREMDMDPVPFLYEEEKSM